MPARKPPSGRRRKGLARLLPDPPQAPKALPYAGLQQGYDPEAAARAALLVEQGYGALEPWLSAEPEPMDMAELVQACLRGSISGFDAAELWRRQQKQKHHAEQLLELDWGRGARQRGNSRTAPPCHGNHHLSESSS